MNAHIHVGALEAAIVAAYLLIIGFLLRSLAARYPDSTFGKAIAYIY